jgi:hypothetical protein
VGTCVAGVQTCGAAGTWGSCIGEVDPAPDVCGGPDSNCDGKLPPQQCPGDVTAKYPLRTGQDATELHLAVDPTTGHVILVGTFEQSVDFGLGPLTSPYSLTAFMLTLDSTLTPIAQAAFGGSNYIDVHTDASGHRAVHMFVFQGESANLGGGAIAGPADVTAMLDQTGTTLLWQKSIPFPPVNWIANVGAVSNQHANMSVVDLVPDYGCAREVDASTSQSVLVQLGPGATCEWETNLTPSIAVISMAARSDGSTAIFGTYDGKQPAALGATTLQAGNPKALLLVVDSNGVVTWADALDNGLVLNTANPLVVNYGGVAVGPNDEIYVAGSSSAWSLDLGGGPMPRQSTPPGNDDFVVARFDPKGKYVWAKRMPGDAIGAGVSWVGAGPTAIFVAGGTSAGNVSFGGGPLGPSFIASLDFDGNYRWSVSEYTDSVLFGAVAGTSFVYAVTNTGNLWQFLY